MRGCSPHSSEDQLSDASTGGRHAAGSLCQGRPGETMRAGCQQSAQLWRRALARMGEFGTPGTSPACRLWDDSSAWLIQSSRIVKTDPLSKTVATSPSTRGLSAACIGRVASRQMPAHERALSLSAAHVLSSSPLNRIRT
eukprot:scaffold102028_cov28-Tisochrysis_lutea.AAC.3